MTPKLPVLAAAMLLAGIFCTQSCSRKTPDPQASVAADSASHYSVRNFVRGQAILLEGQPITLFRILRENGSFDSSLLPITALNWSEVIPAFVNSDISAPQFTGRYQFSISDDDVTATRILTYTATRPDLFTRLFQINTDAETYAVKSIYIENRSSGFWRSRSQKLLYIPGNIVQIQETEDPLIGKTIQKRLEYKFMRDESDRSDVHIVEE